MFQPGAPGTHVICGDERLGREHRMHDRHVNGCKDGDLLGQRAERSCEGEGLEAERAHIHLAAEPLQRAIGRMNSKPARSTSFATSAMSCQSAFHRSGTLVIAISKV